MLFNLNHPLCARRRRSGPNSPELEACKATGLMALKERSPSVKDIILDADSLIVSNTNTEVGGKSQHFLCLIGEKGKVLLTFFTAQ